MDVVALVGDLAACDPATADRAALEECCRSSARVRAWLDGFDVEVGRALEAKTGYGAKVLADADERVVGERRASDRAGRHVARVARDRGCGEGGDVSAAHVDAATRALRQVPETRRGELAAIIDGG